MKTVYSSISSTSRNKKNYSLKDFTDAKQQAIFDAMNELYALIDMGYSLSSDCVVKQGDYISNILFAL